MSAQTFSIRFFSGGKWWLHSWGHRREDVPDLLRQVWQQEKCDGVKAEPTSEDLAGIPVGDEGKGGQA